MKSKIESGPHETFLYKTSPMDILYGILISNLCIYLGIQIDEWIMVVVGLITSVATLFIGIRLLRPDKIVIGTDQILIPRLIPGKSVSLRDQEVKGIVVFKRKFQEYLCVVTKTGKVYEMKVNYIQNWPRCFDLMSSKFSRLNSTRSAPPSKKNLFLIGGFFISIVLGTAQLGLIETNIAMILMPIIAVFCLFPLLKKNK